MKSFHPFFRAAVLAGLTSSVAGLQAQVVFSESFEAPVVSGFDDNTVPSGGKWIGATDGFGATNRGLYNETVAWPATPLFSTPYGKQAYYLNYSNSALTSSAGATGQTLTAGVTYKVTFNAAVTSGTPSGNYRVELVAFGPAEDNSARVDGNGTLPGTVLASSTGAVTTNNMSASAGLVFTPAAGNTHLGKDVGIRLVKSTGSVLYDNIRLITGHDLNPNPANGQDLANGGNVTLAWTNMPPNAPASTTPVDVWFGSNPAALGQVIDGQTVSSLIVSAPTAGNWYWRVDSYPDGDANGTPITGQVFLFTIADTDGDGLPDIYELANTNPASNTALNPGDDLDTDGLTNFEEYNYGTKVNDPDTDDDSLLDGPEINGTAGSRPATNPLLPDTDGDGLGDGVETNTGVWAGAADTGTNPVDKDWDKDGLPDGVETKDGTFNGRTTDTGTDPYLADTDGDGAGDWYEVAATFTDPNSGGAGQTSPIPYPLPDPDPADLGDTNPATPVKVYIMAGQSNTVGIGYVSGGPGSLNTITKIDNKFPNLIDASNAWTKRNDVIYKGVVSATAQGPLTAGQGADSTRVGPELGFGQVMGWYHDEPVLILKASQGNRSLGWDFLPPGSGRWTVGDRTYPAYGESPQSWLTASGAPAPGGWYAGKQYDDCFRAESAMGMISWATGTVYAKDMLIKHNGAAYQCTVAHTGDATTEPGVGGGWTTNWKLYTITNTSDILDFTTGKLKNLPTGGNNLNGRGFQIAGFCWWQGHKDHTDAIYAPRYEQHLVKLINALRTDFQAPNAPVVVASIGFGGGDIATKPALYQAVYNGQMAVGNPALHPDFSGTVKSVNTLPYWRTLAESPGQQDFHYNNNAETYTLVGDAMARAMLSMQDDTSPPAPGPMSFAIAPAAVDATTIGMVATTAIDVSGPVEYYFENTTNGNNSGWITGTRWDNTGLTTGSNYEFRVKARDAKGNEGTWSAIASAVPGNDTTAPTPNPMSFASPFTVLGENSLRMTANPATDINGVQYQFVCTIGGGLDSAWQSGVEFTATGLNPGTEYTYIVRARDSLGNTTADSAPASATTLAPDTTPPTPSAMSFATPPAAIGTSAITMTATTAADPSGVEYFFEAVGGGTSSGWQNSATYTDTSLAPGTEYGYRVRARDKSPAQNTTAWSDVLTATTEVPDTTSPSVLSFNPANGTSNVAINSNLVLTFDEEITQGTGLITIKNLTDATQSTISVTDGAQVSASGAVLTINPTANLAYGKNHAIQIESGAIKDLSDNPFTGITNDTTWSFTTVDPPVTPAETVYEPFLDSEVSLSGNTPGHGLAGTWTAGTGVSVSSGTLSYGSPSALPSTGNKVGVASGNSASISVGSSLSDAGLLADGATLWFSFLLDPDNLGSTNDNQAFSLGTASLGTGNGIAMNSSGNGVGVSWDRGNRLHASHWTNGTRSTNGTSGTIPLNATTLVVGKILWGATGTDNETITLYLPGAGLSQPTPLETYSVAPKTQSGFNIISFSRKGETGEIDLIDEIRFGSSYEAVIGQGGPGPVESFVISPIVAPQTVGTPITGITITAKDATNNTATGFTGTVTFGGSGGFSGTSAAFTAGVLTNVSVTPTVTGSNRTFTVSGAGKTGSTTIATIQTQYEDWGDGVAFDADANGDGISNGMAWILGATGPGVPATALLPVGEMKSGGFEFRFNMLNSANRGGAVLRLQHGGNLGAGEEWTSVTIPDSNGIVDGVEFLITPEGGENQVVATIPVDQITTNRLFARLLLIPTTSP